MATWLRFLMGTLLSLTTAHARIAVQVRGSSELEVAAVAEPTNETLKLQGRLSDELGAPIANAKLQLSTVGNDHTVSRLFIQSTCDADGLSSGANRSRGSLPSSTAGVSAVVSAHDGSFCVRVATSDLRPDSSVRLQYEGSDEYAGTQRTVASADLRQSLVGSFEALTHDLSLDEEAITFSLSITTLLDLGPDQAPTLPLTLSLREPTSTREPRLLKRFNVELGVLTKLVLKSETLGLPGPAELVVSFDGNAQLRPLLLTQKVLRTVQVAFGPLERPARVTAGDTFRLGCSVSSRLGPVTSGSVELAVNGSPQSLERVLTDGKVAFVVTTQKNHPKLSLLFRFLPTQEGFIAARPHTFVMDLPPPSPWRFSGWVIGGLLVVGWLGWSRRQPPRVQDERKTPVPQPPRAHIERLGPPSDANVGWEGLVVDAHEGHPLGAVRITLEQQGFERTIVLFEAYSDSQGAFQIPRRVVPLGVHCALIVATSAYATFATELPQPGLIRLYLVSVRRAILDRLVAWTKKRGTPFRTKAEPTPDWVAQVARRRGNQDVERWAQAVSTAAFGEASPKDAQSADLQPPTGLISDRHPPKPSES